MNYQDDICCCQKQIETLEDELCSLKEEQSFEDELECRTFEMIRCARLSLERLFAQWGDCADIHGIQLYVDETSKRALEELDRYRNDTEERFKSVINRLNERKDELVRIKKNIGN